MSRIKALCISYLLPALAVCPVVYGSEFGNKSNLQLCKQPYALCLVGHVCNILIWAIWVFAPSKGEERNSARLKERLCLLLFAPISVMALFSCLNLTLMAYGVRSSPTAMQVGKAVPAFQLRTLSGKGIDTSMTDYGRL